MCCKSPYLRRRREQTDRRNYMPRAAGTRTSVHDPPQRAMAINRLDHSLGSVGAPGIPYHPRTRGRWRVTTQIANIRPIKAAPKRCRRLSPMPAPAAMNAAPKNATQNSCQGIQPGISAAINVSAGK